MTLGDFTPLTGARFLRNCFRALRREHEERTAVRVWRAEQVKLLTACDDDHLPDVELEYFKTELSNCSILLEYGSGASTLVAIRRVPVVVSVENDPAFFLAVRSRANLAIGQFYPVFVNTGQIGRWGEPLSRKRTRFRLWQWRRYVVAPWRLIEKMRLSPDLVFVDGRFRVACTLESLLRLPANSQCRFLFDDFEQFGDAYFPILDFVQDVERHGRAISFRRASNLDEEGCRAVLAKHYADFR